MPPPTGWYHYYEVAVSLSNYLKYEEYMYIKMEEEFLPKAAVQAQVEPGKVQAQVAPGAAAHPITHPQSELV
jgi:hypothetical protein